MTPSAERYLQRKPNARPSTLKRLEKRDEKTEQLERENRAKADAAVNEYRSRVRHQPLAGLLMKAKRFFGEMFGGWVA